MSDIVKLEAEANELERQLHEKRMELYRWKVAALPWKAGDLVRTAAGQECKIVAVAHVDFGWPKIVDRKKNGEWGMRERTLYNRDFEVITKGHDNGTTT